MGKKYIQHARPTEFFNEYLSLEDREKIKSLKGKNIKKGSLSIKTIKSPSRYDKENVFYVVTTDKEIDYKELKSYVGKDKLSMPLIQDLLDLSFQKGTFICTGSKSNWKINDIFKNIANTDCALGHDLISKYHQYVIGNSKEVELMHDNLWLTQQAMIKYLEENKIEKKVYPIDYDTQDEDSTKKWFNKMYKLEKHLPAYNDLDYIPFIINGTYVIEDVSSSTLLIYKSQSDTSGSWYQVPRNEFEDDDLSDARYSSNQYITRSIDEQCDEYSLVAEIKDKKIVRASSTITNLELLQNYIFDELERKNKIKRDAPEVDLDQLIGTYRMIHDYWGHESNDLNFFKLLNDKNLKEVKSRLTFNDYFYISKETITNSKAQTIPERAEVLNAFLKREDVDFSQVKKLTNKTKKVLTHYMEENVKTIDGLNTDVLEVIKLLEKELSTKPVKKKTI